MSFDYGWGNDGSFWLKFPSCTRVPNPWKEELFSAARTIAGRTSKPLWLCFSGGIDSELMCRAFRAQNIPFSVLTIEHAAGTNEHDIYYAKKWCMENGVNQKIVKLDIDTFFNLEIDRYLENPYVVTNRPFRFLQMYLLETVENMGGYAVLGGGEQLYTVDGATDSPKQNDAHLTFEPGYAIPLEWCKKNNTSHEPYFFFSTPEICLSYLQIPTVEFALTQPNLFKAPTNPYFFKRIIYHSIVPTLEARTKYDGFERISPQTSALRKRLEERFGPRLEPYKLPIPSFRKELTASWSRSMKLKNFIQKIDQTTQQ